MSLLSMFGLLKKPKTQLQRLLYQRHAKPVNPLQMYPEHAQALSNWIARIPSDAIANHAKNEIEESDIVSGLLQLQRTFKSMGIRPQF